MTSKKPGSALNNHWILLTGASGGIGEALAKELYGVGAKLLLVGRDAQKLQLLKTRCAFDNSRTVLLQADITQAEDRARILATCQKMPEPVSVLINNAGLSDFHFLEQQSPLVMANLVETNLLAPMLLTHMMLPILKKAATPLVVNIGSTFGSIGYPGYSVYCASKFGLRGFTEALRRELADTSIDVCYVAPRATRTGINSDLVNEMNMALGNTQDEPAHVARALRQAMETRRPVTYLGWPEKLFARLNQILPAVVDNALRKQLPIIRQFSQQRTTP